MDFELLTFPCNNNTGYLLHAISPKSKEHIACYKHYNKLQIHCCKTLLRNIVTVTVSYRTLTKHFTHSSSSTAADKGLRKTNNINNGYIQAVSRPRQDGKGVF